MLINSPIEASSFLDTNEFESFMTSKDAQYRYILDWLNRRGSLAVETDILDLKTLTFEQALQKSEDWHERLAKSVEVLGPSAIDLSSDKINSIDPTTISDWYTWE